MMLTSGLKTNKSSLLRMISPKFQAERDALKINKDEMEQQMYAKDREIDDLEEEARKMEYRFKYLLSEIARLEGEHARGL
jgi:predicted  nucleic acid-binding Zn-ribbon protein